MVDAKTAPVKSPIPRRIVNKISDAFDALEQRETHGVLAPDAGKIYRKLKRNRDEVFEFIEELIAEKSA